MLLVSILFFMPSQVDKFCHISNFTFVDLVTVSLSLYHQFILQCTFLFNSYESPTEYISNSYC